jgi:hypothetical protein
MAEEVWQVLATKPAKRRSLSFGKGVEERAGLSVSPSIKKERPVRACRGAPRSFYFNVLKTRGRFIFL